MNRRATKFLRAVALTTGTSERELRRRWNALSHTSRGQIRRNLPIHIAEGTDTRRKDYAIFLNP